MMDDIERYKAAYLAANGKPVDLVENNGWFKIHQGAVTTNVRRKALAKMAGNLELRKRLADEREEQEGGQ